MDVKTALTMPVPRPMKRFWKYLQGEVHIAFLVGHANWARQFTNVRSHSHSWCEQLVPLLLLSPTKSRFLNRIFVFVLCHILPQYGEPPLHFHL